jgi:ABC-type enterochelin transport system substrate-binding protein
MIKHLKMSQMKKLLIILSLAFTACTNTEKTEQQTSKHEHESENTATTVPINTNTKWKADEPTKRNVAAMMAVVHDSSYADAGKRMQLYAALKTKVDTLINQCRMKGPDHDALHGWLEKVLDDMKELKKEGANYSEAYAALKKDIDSFNTLFE